MVVAALLQYLQATRWQGRFSDCAYVFVSKSTTATSLIVRDKHKQPSAHYPTNNVDIANTFNGSLTTYHIVESSPEFGGECRVVFGCQFGECMPPIFTLHFTNGNGSQIILYRDLDRLNVNRSPDGYLLIDYKHKPIKLKYFIIQLKI